MPSLHHFNGSNHRTPAQQTARTFPWTSVRGAGFRNQSRAAATFRQPLVLRILLLGALLIAGFGAALTTAPAALAHDELISSTPADGSVLDEAPAEVELVFSSALMDIGNQVIVADAAGTNLVESDPVLNRETLVQPLPVLENGDYQVNWRAVSSDGHPITGTFSFTVGAAGSGAEATESAAAGTVSEPATDEATGPAPEASAIADSQNTESVSFGAWGWVLTIAGAVLVGVIIYAVVVILKKRRRGADS